MDSDPISDSNGAGNPAWLHGHPHEPNPAPPGVDATMCLELPDGTTQTIAPADLATLPQAQVEDCYIVSTGHGASGPFRFSGVRLADFLHAYVPAGLAWSAVDVISGDGFGNRIYAQELTHNRAPTSRAILLATQVDGEPLARAAGLVRLIVPSETEDALRQVKWVARIVVHDV